MVPKRLFNVLLIALLGAYICIGVIACDVIFPPNAQPIASAPTSTTAPAPFVASTKPTAPTPDQLAKAAAPVVGKLPPKVVDAAQKAAPIIQGTVDAINQNPGNRDAGINAVSSGAQGTALAFGGTYGPIAAVGISLFTNILLAWLHARDKKNSRATTSATVANIVDNHTSQVQDILDNHTQTVQALIQGSGSADGTVSAQASTTATATITPVK